MYDDTIAAIATPPGEGGVGMIRVSGREARAVAAAIFRPARPGPLRPFRLRYGHVVDPASGAVVDEVLCAFMRAPRSFTCEDVVEISCHGGPLPVQTTLALALAAGARLAHPGEFTLRAFLNGRIDLTQAEAGLDVVRAQTSAGLALAQAQLGGWLAREVRAARAGLMECLAYITAVVDFPEDEVPAQEIGPQLRAGLAAAEGLLAGADQGVIYRQGARVALVGRPNVGKSSLLNALLRADRAIVTPIPGTTRDTLEETANLGGIPVVLIDTAGIHTSADPVEQLGVERARQALQGADLALLVLDATEPVGPGDLAIAALAREKPTIVVWNKAEGGPPSPLAPLPERARGAGGGRAGWGDVPLALATVATSATTGAGIEDLAQAVARALLGGAPPAAGEARLVSSPRHRDALQRAVDHLRAAVDSWGAGRPADLLAGDLTVALNALGEITGETVGDDLLDLIFSRFCIGK
ncbi:MAG: tRNA uridine-5-carboxymethylaminomethyl(34) synthesis GTPase MnmE [Chloroflexales bacterium]